MYVPSNNMQSLSTIWALSTHKFYSTSIILGIITVFYQRFNLYHWHLHFHFKHTQIRFMHVFSLFQPWRSFPSGIPPSLLRPSWTADSYSPKTRSPNPSSPFLSLLFRQPFLSLFAYLFPSLRFLAFEVVPTIRWIEILSHVRES